MFKIFQRRNTWVMQLDLDINPSLFDGPVFKWELAEIDRLVEDLKDRPGVRRMSYDMWYWKSNYDLERFLTYWYLKYGQQ